MAVYLSENPLWLEALSNPIDEHEARVWAFFLMHGIDLHDPDDAERLAEEYGILTDEVLAERTAREFSIELLRDDEE